MKQVVLGKSGVTAPAIGVGCMRIDKMEESALSRYIHTALECGITFFDHADIYGGGNCEALFGRVLAKEPGLRDKLVLQSKCGIRSGLYDFSREHIRSSVEGILSRLGTDHLDFLLLHRPDALMEPEEVAEVFTQLEQEGKVLHFGVSNFNARQLELLQAAVKQPLCVNQLQFSLMHAGLLSHALETNTQFPHAADRDGEVLDYCRLHQVTVQAWSPFRRYPDHCGHHQPRPSAGHCHRLYGRLVPGGLVRPLFSGGQPAALTGRPGIQRKREGLLHRATAPLF